MSESQGHGDVGESQVFGPEARDRARLPDTDADTAEDDGERPGAAESARMCGVKAAVDEVVRAEGGWLGVTSEARARSWYWITSPDRFLARVADA